MFSVVFVVIVYSVLSVSVAFVVSVYVIVYSVLCVRPMGIALRPFGPPKKKRKKKHRAFESYRCPTAMPC